jgi:4-diphosphocytidyl-2-C-methyl-D-erythritol kinase
MSEIPTMTLPSPAKINLMLAVTGVRPDGFHDLVSLVAPLVWGDRITVRLDGADTVDQLCCNQPDVPVDGSNLVLRAVSAFRAVHPLETGVSVELEKNIPVGAGLGGGSGNAATTLLALNRLLGEPLGMSELEACAASVGSDCPLFLHEEPMVMRGRGEQLRPLPAAARAWLQGRPVAVFRPDFGIATVWAYQRFRETGGQHYLPPAEAEARLANWVNSPGEDTLPLYNNFEAVTFDKYLALPAMLQAIREEHGLAPRMSGSGSACFALLPEHFDPEPLEATVRHGWGENALFVVTRIR